MRAKLAFAGLALFLTLVIACGEEDSTSWQTASFDEVVEFADVMEAASFNATYEIESSAEEDEGYFENLELTKLDSVLVEHLVLADEDTYFRSDIHEESEVADASESYACGLRELTSTDELICLDQADDAWTLLLTAFLPAPIYFNDSDLNADDFQQVESSERRIAGVEGKCFRFVIPEGETGAAEFCVGDQGELLYQKLELGGETVAITAEQVRSDVSERDLEIPYEVVDEEDLPGGACTPPACKRPD